MVELKFIRYRSSNGLKIKAKFNRSIKTSCDIKITCFYYAFTDNNTFELSDKVVSNIQRLYINSLKHLQLSQLNELMILFDDGNTIVEDNEFRVSVQYHSNTSYELLESLLPIRRCGYQNVLFTSRFWIREILSTAYNEKQSGL